MAFQFQDRSVKQKAGNVIADTKHYPFHRISSFRQCGGKHVFKKQEEEDVSRRVSVLFEDANPPGNSSTGSGDPQAMENRNKWSNTQHDDAEHRRFHGISVLN